jgi:hypothetical protein
MASHLTILDWILGGWSQTGSLASNRTNKECHDWRGESHAVLTSQNLFIRHGTPHFPSDTVPGMMVEVRG